MFMRYDCTLQYVRGRTLKVADALSKAMQLRPHYKQWSLDIEVHALGMLAALACEAAREQLRTE